MQKYKYLKIKKVKTKHLRLASIKENYILT